MYSITRRILPVAAAIAVTATLSAWVTAGAQQSNVRQNAVTVMHFRTVVTSRHLSLNGATEKNLAGAVFTATAKLVAQGRQIGSAYLVVTFVTASDRGIADVSLSFPGKGRMEVSGAWTLGGSNTAAITGGTGLFTGAAGTFHGSQKLVTLKYS